MDVASVHGILQARTLEWFAIPSPGDLPNPEIEPESPASPTLTGGFFTTVPPGKPYKICTGTTQRDGMGREEGGGFRMGNTCKPVADSF